MINMQNTNQRLMSLSFQLERMQAQIMDIQANNQSTHGEQENIPTRDEKVGEIVEEDVDETEEEIKLEGCGIMNMVEEIEMPHEVEFPQEQSYTVEAKTIDDEEVTIVAEKQEWLLSKEKSYMNKRGRK